MQWRMAEYITNHTILGGSGEKQKSDERLTQTDGHFKGPSNLQWIWELLHDMSVLQPRDNLLLISLQEHSQRNVSYIQDQQNEIGE